MKMKKNKLGIIGNATGSTIVEQKLNLGIVKTCSSCNKKGHYSKLFKNYFCDGCYDKKLNES